MGTFKKAGNPPWAGGCAARDLSPKARAFFVEVRMPELKDGSMAGDVMRECERRGITLTAIDATQTEPGYVRMAGPVGSQADMEAMQPLVTEHCEFIFGALKALEMAEPPPRLADLH